MKNRFLDRNRNDFIVRNARIKYNRRQVCNRLIQTRVKKIYLIIYIYKFLKRIL